MTSATTRNNILGAIRKSLKRGPLSDDKTAALRQSLNSPKPTIIPNRAVGTEEELAALFDQMAESVAASVSHVDDFSDIGASLSEYLRDHNLPGELKVAPDQRLDSLESESMLTVRRGRADPMDAISVTIAFAGIAETGTLVLQSGPETPTSLNFMPDVNVIVLPKSLIYGNYEEAWKILRSQGNMPRTVNMITGPSRTGDIEQTIQLGAHGPRRLHIVVVDNA